MSNSDLGKDFELSSGNSCQILRIRKGLIPNYYILAFPKTQGESNPEDVSEMLTLGTSHDQKLVEKGYSHMSISLKSLMHRQDKIQTMLSVVYKSQSKQQQWTVKPVTKPRFSKVREI